MCALYCHHKTASGITKVYALSVDPSLRVTTPTASLSTTLPISLQGRHLNSTSRYEPFQTLNTCSNRGNSTITLACW